MTREEAITVFKAFMENPLFSDVHKQAFNIAIHDIKQRHDWDINKLMLVPKTEWKQEPRWIPVSERLPEDNKYYLVTIELTFSRSDRYVDIQNAGGWDSLRKCGHEVVAWMPSPKAYKPQESEEV